MKFGLRSKMLIVFGLLIFISVGNFGFLWVADKNADEQQARVTHTFQVLKHSEVLLGHLRDAETGQRGFLLTGKQTYLEPFEEGAKAANSVFQLLADLTSDNPLQQSRLEIIKDHISRKLEELSDTIQLTQQGKRNEAMAIVNSDVGRQIMDTIRVNLGEFIEEEERFLKEREARFKFEQERFRTLFVFEVVLLISLIFIIAVLIQRRLVTPVVDLTRNASRFAAGKEVVDIHVSSTDEMGQLAGAFNNMTREITSSLKRLEIAQKESEEKGNRLSEIIQGTNIGTWEWNLFSDDFLINERWAEIIGYTRQELGSINSRALRKLCHPDETKIAFRKLKKHFSGELEYYDVEARMRHKDGYWVWVQNRGKLVERDGEGKPLRMSGTLADITARKEIEKAKAEFISTVSHELRTPLTSIKGSLGLIKSGTAGEMPKKLTSMLDIAYNNSDRLVLLINDILDMEKIEAGKMDFHLKPVAVQTLLDEAMEANKGYGDEHKVTFVRSGDDEQILIEGDKDRLMQVLSNLMSNAAKFSPDGEQVELIATRKNGTARIAVRDKGPGVPEQFRESIFEKFSQADSSDTRKVGGTGLGLSITKAIVEQHGGIIGLDSETSKGTTFFFDLPVMSESTETAPFTVSEAPQYRILICEDEKDIATLLEMMLGNAGFQTSTARTAAQAKQKLEKDHFDAMTLDLALPDQNGIFLLQELRENPKTHDLPVIIVSATADDGRKELNGDAVGVIDWIEKPIDPNLLVGRLKNALSIASSEQPRILHVEDNEGVLQIVSALVGDTGEVVAARSVDEAKKLLENEPFDLVVLDLMLPDGNGEFLLPMLNSPERPSIPVIVFSALDVSHEMTKKVQAALIKTQTSNEQLLKTIRSIIQKKRAAE